MRGEAIQKAREKVILDRYSSVIDDAAREALQNLLADLKQDLIDLQNELASLMANFGEQADSVADFLTGEARQDGFAPDDPNNYGLGPNDVPWVDVPDISNVPGAFDPANDPYAAYADSVIASLGENVSNGVVVNRASFVALVKAWRSNTKALEKALQARVSVSQAETAAFLNAQNKVTGYLQKYMNGSGWFHDSPVPQDVRVDVDGPLKNLYGVLAEDLKEALLIWEAKNNPPEANLFFDTLRAFSAGMQAAEEVAQEYRDTMKTMVHGASRIAIGFVPFVGPAMDICEAVTGKEWCLPSGRTLTTGERVFSGIGFGVGKVVKVWKGISSAAISTEGKGVAAAIVTLAPDLVEKLAKARIQNWKTLTRGSILPKTVEKLDNDWEVTSLLALIEKKNHKVLSVGDGSRDVLGIVMGADGKWPKHADFLSVSPNGSLIISEAKFPRKALNERPAGVDCFGAVAQLRSSMEHAVKKGVAQDVELVQIVFPKGAVLTVQKETNTVTKVVTEFHYMIEDGYLLENGKRIPMPGKPDFFVKVLELEVTPP
jgi:hypothetical protein